MNKIDLVNILERCREYVDYDDGCSTPDQFQARLRLVQDIDATLTWLQKSVVITA